MHALAVNLLLIVTIPAYGLLLTRFPGDDLDEPSVASAETKYVLKQYLKKDCSFLYAQTTWELNAPGYLRGYFENLGDGFDGGNASGGAAVYREFTCNHGVLQSNDRWWPRDSAIATQTQWWIAPLWRDLFLRGKCVATPLGGLQMEPPIPLEEVDHLNDCADDPESVTHWYRDRHCLSGVTNYYRAQAVNPNFTGCVDTVGVAGERYGLAFECIDHALQESHYGDFLSCDPRSLNGNGRVYSHQFWKRYVTGQCVRFDFQWSAKLSYQYLSEEAIAKIEETECGNPQAEFHMFTAPGCHVQDRIVVSDLVAKTGDCIHMTTMQSRRSIRAVAKPDCWGNGVWGYSLFAYNRGDCLYAPYWAVRLTGQGFEDLKAERCVTATEGFTNMAVYFKLSIRNSNPFDDVEPPPPPATTTTTSLTGGEEPAP